MKKFLKDLEKELKKLHMNNKDIAEIMADHTEMLEQALYDGLTDEEIEIKFGDPKNLAKELNGDSEGKKEIEKEVKKDGDALHKSFPAKDLKNVNIGLVSDDFEYLTHDKDTIEVYFKNIENPNKYDVSFKNGLFELRKESTVSLFRISFKTKSGKIKVLVPKNIVLEEFSFKSVSGDSEICEIDAKTVLIKSTSADIQVKGIKATNSKITTVSGDCNIETFEFGELNVSSVSGDFNLEDGKIEGKLNLNTVSGDFNIKNVKSGEAKLHTVSGDLDGKEFYPSIVNLKAVSGDIKIRNNDKLKEIEIGSKKTVSGSISIK